MAIFKCKMCGGALEITEGLTTCECSYCGTSQTLPKLNNDKKANLYDRADHFRRNNDFDKAMSIYEQILNEDTTDAEAYWSLVLCKYGIEYVDDPATHKKVPTVNRAQYTSIYSDENYKAALQYADSMQKNLYEVEAKVIDDIQKGILEISNKEEPFDVFICYKETDNNGRRTQDSVLANDLYHQLTQEGFKVFFSRITLEDKLGSAYEPYIFAALNSAKVMVALGTKPEFFNAVWVRNEWSRYLAIVKQSEGKKMLIPAYRDMDPYDLPEEFSHLQAQDMSKLGFMQDLIRGIKKILGVDKVVLQQNESVDGQHNVINSTADAQVQRGNIELEDAEWEKAEGFFEEALNYNPQCAEAYLGKLMAKYKCSNILSLKQYYISKYESLETDKLDVLEACPEALEHIEKMVSECIVFGFLSDSEIRKQYIFNRTYISELSLREQQKNQQMVELDNEKLLVRARQYATGDTKVEIENIFEEIAQNLDARIANAKNSDNKMIDSISDKYKAFLFEVDGKVKELCNKALIKQESTYNARVQQMNSAKAVSEYESVRDLLLDMNGYKDTLELAEKCKNEIDKLEQEEQLARKKEIERQAKEKKRKTIRVLIVLVVGVFISIAVTKVIIINNNYNKALQLMANEQYDNAINVFITLGNYRDSNKLRAQAELRLIKAAQRGDIVHYGNYKGETEWVVLDKVDGKVLLISKHPIEKKPYNTENVSVTWESSSIRGWLNSKYINSAFSSYEQTLIISTTVKNVGNYKFNNVDGGNTTNDKVFLLSLNEANIYFSSDGAREAKSGGKTVWWWLRSPGRDSMSAAYVEDNGCENYNGYGVNRTEGNVRPAIWVNAENL